MRPLEIFLTIFLVVSACSLVSKSLFRPWVWLVVDVVFLLAHLFLEGAHWQMIPAYGSVVLFAGVVALQVSGMRILLASAMVVLCLATIGLSAVLPMFRLPAPTGPYPIGTRVIHLPAPDGPGQHGRELMIQVWYPAAPSRRPFAPYRRREETTLQSSYQSVVPTHSRLEAPVMGGDERFPVLLFSPAWGGRRTQNTYLMEDLASHGYVVAGIDHPGNSGPTAFPDGRVDQPGSVERLDFSKQSYDEIEATLERELTRQTADEIQVLNDLERRNETPGDPFYQRLDTARAGALGHSFGAAVGAEAALEDNRILAVLDLDGSIYGRVQREGLPKPFLFISEDASVPLAAPAAAKLSRMDQINNRLDENDAAMLRHYGALRLFVHGSSHESYTDHPLFSPLQSLSGAGTISKYRQYSIVRQYALAFFDKTLRGEDPQLLKDVPGPFPEATLEVVPAS